MRRVIIESPYRFQTIEEHQKNLDYLYKALRDSIYRDESPYASHLFIPQVLNDNDPEERLRGIQCGYAWWKATDLIVFYVDLGWSDGMGAALKQATTMRFPYEIRKICK